MHNRNELIIYITYKGADSFKMRTRNIAVRARLNKSEHAFFVSQVRRSRLSQEAYIRILISGHVPREQPHVEYHELIRAMRFIGNNINQITARANATGYIDVKQFKAEAQHLRESILEIKRQVTAPDRME
jgi:Bacterial mobilisation protein (MobC).